MTEQESRRGKSRRERVEFARSRDILDVANELQMELVRSGRDYRWKEHDSLVISPDKNLWKWFSRNTGGDAISLVETIKEVDFNQSVDFLNDGNFKEFQMVERAQEDFKYYLEKYEQSFSAGRDYLRNKRGLSDETIDYFLEQGVLAQANAKLDYFAEGDGGVTTNAIEPVIVFKSLSSSGEVVGASLQGIQENWEKWPKHGYAKVIMKNSDPMTGIHVDIGSPKRLIFTESPIDLMSYYELHKDSLQDVRLVSMDGLKESTIGRHLSQIQAEISGKSLRWTPEQLADGLQVAIDRHFFEDGKNADLITLALDNDKAGRTFIQKLEAKGAVINSDLPELRPGQDKTDWNDVLKNQQVEKTDSRKSEYEEMAEATLSESSHFPDTSHLSPEDATWLKENWNNIGFSVETRKQMVIDSDKTVTYEKPSNPLRDDREPKKQIQSTEKTLEKSQGQLNDRASGGEGYSQPYAVGSAKPEAESSATFEQTVTSHPTSPYRYLHFSTNFEEVQRRQSKYHPITPDDLKRMNQYASSIQKSSQWYLEELANSKIYYFYSNNGEVSLLDVNFKRENFLHLTGIRPVVPGRNAGDFVVDFAEGRGNYNQILVSNSLKEKLQVIPMLEDILDPKSFVLDNLDEVRIAQRLNFSEAIKSKDEDFLLLFKDIGEERVPASLMKIKRDLKVDVEKTKEKVILAVFRERDGNIEQLSINEDYVKDRGNELQTILKDGLFEEIKPDTTKGIEQITPENTLNSPLLDSAMFTQVLDTVYNLGVPGDISKTPEEFHQAWNQYLDYAKRYNDKFDQIVAAAGEDHLLDTNSDFYKEWKQDHIYKENYHVRLQWAEERPDGPKLPFKETELISYQDFARELYKANQDFYPIHQEGMKQVTAGNTEGYIPPTKIKFDIYAPGGEVIKEGIRYDIGDETRPISQMLGLGYRRLNGQSELASMDEEILSQLENREVNKEISQEANESTRLTEEVTGQTLDTRETVAFQSSKQETKNNLLQRVEEILKEEPISNLETPEVNSSSIDYATLTPHELSEVAFQKVREYTETPERLEEYLNFMSKFPELSPRNVALIQEQWPGANAVATYNQWQSMGEALGITSDQVFETRNTYTNKKTGRTREVVHNNLSVKTGEKSHITLFRPMMVEMIPVLDENGNQVKNGKGNPKYKRLSEATPEEKALKKQGKLKSRFFQERDSKTGLAKFATYKVFELSQTTLKPEFYPKAMPNRHYDFNMDHIRTKEVLEGLSDYAKNIGVTIYQDDVKELRSAKGAFYPDEQKILLNPDNTPGEVVATTIHELAHASLYNPKFANSYKEDVSKDRRELEAEMTSYLVSKHFGLDTSEKAIRYMALWTDNLTSLDDQQLAQSMKRIHGTVSKIVKSVEQHTKPYQLNRQVVQNQNFIQSPKKGLKI
ncbi:TPA: toprim domain-containing protein [Streptococcus pneumoniae]|nr:toprim domain-containing protein [Streptococcus pneumoniae]